MDNHFNRPEEDTTKPRETETPKEPAADQTGLLALIIVVIAMIVLYFVFRPHHPSVMPNQVPAVQTNALPESSQNTTNTAKTSPVKSSTDKKIDGTTNKNEA
ncbi:MAG: hypothetical protein CMF38_02550 [Legionellaceae bacterium]|nr:hypothetical protein [Legionellaceae bacterium]HCA89985.1 hypothetical protein [Legionellales bacterium]|tara:strand:- start:55 stop:360 length:306 start_codon:yes stop_codon:yes gene_type:complete